MFTERAGTEPRQSRPRLRSQALADKWSGFEMMAPMVYSQEGPHTRQIWVQICLGRRKLCSGELWHFFYNMAPPPPSVPITPPHSDRQNLCWRSGSQNLPLLLKLADCYLNGREPSLLKQQHKIPVKSLVSCLGAGSSSVCPATPEGISAPLSDIPGIRSISEGCSIFREA